MALQAVHKLIYTYAKSKVDPFPSHKSKTHGAALISVLIAVSQTPVYTPQDHGYGASYSASRGTCA